MKLPAFLFALLVLVVSTPITYSAEFILTPQQDARTVQVSLDTKGDTINAIEGNIRLTGDVSSVSFSQSVIPLWVERPTASSLRFSGIVPGGFVGSQGPLFSFQVAPGAAVAVRADSLAAYLNDGLGTATSAISSAIELPNSHLPAQPSGDHEIPELTGMRVTRDPAVFDNDWFLVFSGHDGGTGIAGYEVAERRGVRTDHTDGLTWSPAETPYRLVDQTRSSTIFVRATDGAGNTTIATLPPQESRLVNMNAVMGLVAIMLLALGALVVWRRYRSR